MSCSLLDMSLVDKSNEFLLEKIHLKSVYKKFAWSLHEQIFFILDVSETHGVRSSIKWRGAMDEIGWTCLRVTKEI